MLTFLKNFSKSFTKCLSAGAVLALTLAGCDKAEVNVDTPKPAVSVYEIHSEKVGKYREFVARTEAFKEVNLKARVEGELIERGFKEGGRVEKGQMLFKIDPAAYHASLAAVKADLSSAKAGQQRALRDLTRGKELSQSNYISQSDLDKLLTNEAQAVAAVKAAEAAVEKAELDLSYTTITAPFSGRIGKVNFNIGNIITLSSEPLATLTATDPIYVNFQVDEGTMVSYMQNQQKSVGSEPISFDLSLRLPNNTLYPEKGELNFSDTKIEEGMGTVELRAIFPNEKGIILPGLFVTLVLESKDKELMALVPQVAVQENQQGKFVLVLDEQNIVQQRIVKLGRRINAMWVVEAGLSDKDIVIIEGLQKVRSGIEVKPVYKKIDPITGVISDHALPEAGGNITTINTSLNK